MAYRYTDPNTRAVFSSNQGYANQAGKTAKFWLNADGTGPVDIGLYGESAPETPGASTGSNQLTVQADGLWPAMWDRDGDQDHVWVQVGTASNPGELYRIFCDADQRLDAVVAAVEEIPVAPTGVLYSRLRADGADESAAFLAELATLQATGGTWMLPAGTIRVDSRIVVPNDGLATYPRQKSMRWVGTGAYSDPKGGSGPYPDLTGIGGTILDLRYAGGGSGLSKILTTGKGWWESTGITYTDLGASSNAFIKTTNTALNFHGNAFVGNGSKQLITCDQDALVLGGLTTGEGSSGEDAGFQGYGTVIRDNYFARIRRAVLGQVFCNAVVIADNNVWITCGSNLPNGAAIEINNQGVGSSFTVGNVIRGNLIEMGGYIYGVTLDWSIENTLIGNNFYDPGAGSIAGYWFASTQAKSNVILGGYYPNTMTVAAQTGGSLNDYNTVIRSLGSGTTNFASLLLAGNGLQTKAPGGGTGNQVVFTPPSGASVVMKNYGRTWGWSDATGGPLLIDTGSGGSNFDIRAFTVRLMRFADGATELIRMRAAPHSATQGAMQLNSTGPIWTSCTGTPEAQVSAPVGSMCTRTDGGAGTTLYVKESGGTGNTGWVAK